ncbi:hypothetical protein [Variovorax gossypii]
MALAISLLCILLGAFAGGFIICFFFVFMLRHADRTMGVEDTSLRSLSEPKR